MTDAEQVIRGELEPGESLLWTGKPRRRIKFISSDLLILPLLAILGTTILFVENGRTLGCVLLGLLALALLERFGIDLYRRARTYYGLTPSRIIIIGGLLRRTVKSTNLREVTTLRMSLARDGSGTITADPAPHLENRMMLFPYVTFSAKPRTPALETIDEVRAVYERILSAQELLG